MPANVIWSLGESCQKKTPNRTAVAGASGAVAGVVCVRAVDHSRAARRMASGVEGARIEEGLAYRRSMASCFSHPAVPLALACWLPKVRRRALLVAAALLSAMPDLDAIGYFQGVPYEAWNGHRGCTHSLVFAVVVVTVPLPETFNVLSPVPVREMALKFRAILAD